MPTTELLLGKYQLFRLCQRLRSQGFSGNLIIQEPEGKTVLFLQEGQLRQVSSTHVAFSFPAFLLRRRRLERAELKQLLEEATEKGIRLEDHMVAKGLLSAKELLRLRRELSEYVFSAAFRKERIPYRLVAGGSDSEEAAARPQIELYEAFFRAVASDPDTTVMTRLFTDRWDHPLVKSADFYRYLIQFRSVFFGEDISEPLMTSEPTPQKVIDLAEEKELALRQLFALVLTGMVSLASHEELGRSPQSPFGPQAGEAEENKTVVIMPEEIRSQAPVTAFLGERDIPLSTADEPASLLPQCEPVRPQDIQDFLDQGFAPFEAPPAAAEPAPTSPATAGPVDEVTAPTGVDDEELVPVALVDDEPPGAPTDSPAGTPAAPPPERGGELDALLEMAIAEAEQIVAESQEVAPPDKAGDKEATPPAAVEPRRRTAEQPRVAQEPRQPATAAGPVARGRTGEQPRPESERITEESPLALRSAPPVPERPEQAEQGTDEALERILEDVYRTMTGRTFYQILNVTPASPLSTVRDHAVRLKGKYSQKQYGSYMLSTRARTLLDLVAAEIDRACEVLTDRAQRLLYDEKNGSDYGQDRRAAISLIFQAEEASREGRDLMARERWEEALLAFTRAVEANPRDPDYLAHKGWATWMAFRGSQGSDEMSVNRARNTLERALAIDPRNQRAMLFLARMEKELNNIPVARMRFEQLAKLDPTNDEVAASLEWLKLSAGVSRRAPAKQGLWARLLSFLAGD